MDKVLLSIRPKWCALIADGIKTIEVRKTAPKEVPFKCLIYQTKSRDNSIYKRFKVDDMCCGKVIGEFICDKVYKINNNGSFIINDDQALTNEIAKDSCLDYKDMNNYLGDKDGYAWHISELKLYDKPKDLSEFAKPCKHSGDDCICGCCKQADFDEEFNLLGCKNQITRPPQSWQYIEEVK